MVNILWEILDNHRKGNRCVAEHNTNCCRLWWIHRQEYSCFNVSFPSSNLAPWQQPFTQGLTEETIRQITEMWHNSLDFFRLNTHWYVLVLKCPCTFISFSCFSCLCSDKENFSLDKTDCHFSTFTNLKIHTVYTQACTCAQLKTHLHMVQWHGSVHESVPEGASGPSNFTALPNWFFCVLMWVRQRELEKKNRMWWREGMHL